jgi:hypothetical protein
MLARDDHLSVGSYTDIRLTDCRKNGRCKIERINYGPLLNKPAKGNDCYRIINDGMKNTYPDCIPRMIKVFKVTRRQTRLRVVRPSRKKAGGFRNRYLPVGIEAGPNSLIRGAGET